MRIFVFNGRLLYLSCFHHFMTFMKLGFYVEKSSIQDCNFVIYYNMKIVFYNNLFKIFLSYIS